MAIHILHHIPFHPFKCTNCDQGFKRRQDLRKHVQKHAETRTVETGNNSNYSTYPRSTRNSPPQGRHIPLEGESSRLNAEIGTGYLLGKDAAFSSDNLAALSAISSTSTNPWSRQGSSVIGSCVFRVANDAHLPTDVVYQCVDGFFEHVFPVCPIIHQESFRNRLQLSEELDTTEKLLLLSLCGLTVMRAPLRRLLTWEARFELGERMLQLCFQLKQSQDKEASTSLTSIQASYLLCLASGDLQKPHSQRFYLREAIRLLYTNELHVDEAHGRMDHCPATYGKRISALLFIAERRCAILQNQPTSIRKRPQLPDEYYTEEDRAALPGTSVVLSLFSLLSDDVVKSGTSASNQLAFSGGPTDIARIHRLLDHVLLEDKALTDSQKANALVTCQWLRLVLWQVSLRKGLLSSSAMEPIFQYTFPMAIARGLHRVMETLSAESLLINGSPLFDEVFDITFALMDALTVAKLRWSESCDLQYLLAWFSAPRFAKSIYHEMLNIKLNAEMQ